MAKKAFNTYKGSGIAARHRKLQKQVARAADKRAPAEEAAHPIQAGARHYPEPPFPRQHLPKAGPESQLRPAPMYDAPFYEGSGKLKDKVAIITGADSGIGCQSACNFGSDAHLVMSMLSRADDTGL